MMFQWRVQGNKRQIQSKTNKEGQWLLKEAKSCGGESLGSAYWQ
jgi:hypothetical protein